MKMERKIMVIGLCVMLVSICLSALATRTITDSSDSVYTKIICSNGNVYDPTAADLQKAIYSLNSTNGGWIRLPACTISCTQPIKCNTSVSLYGAGLATFGAGIGVTTIEIVNASFTGKALMWYNTSNSAAPLQSIVIEQIVFQGNGNQVAEDGLLMKGTYFATIRNCAFSRFQHPWPYGNALNFSELPSQIGYYGIIQGSRFIGNTVGLKLHHSSNNFNSYGNHFNGGTSDTHTKVGIWLDNGDTFKDYGSDFDGFGNVGDKAIYIGPSANSRDCSFIGSRFEGNYDVFYTPAGTGGKERFTDCTFYTTTNRTIDDRVGNCRVRDCVGYTTEKSAQAVITAGTLYTNISTSYLTNERLPYVMLTKLTNTNRQLSWNKTGVTTGGTLYFHVRINGTSGSNIYFYYYASSVYDGTGDVS